MTSGGPAPTPPWLRPVALSTCMRVRAVGNVAGTPPASLVSWLGMRWPTEVGASTVADGRAVLCLGPTDWLLLGQAQDPSPPALGDGEPWVTADQSSALVAFAIDDPRAEDLLACVCALDFRPPRWPVNCCTRTRMAGVAVVLWKQSAVRWLILTAAGYSEYLPQALAAAGPSRDA